MTTKENIIKILKGYMCCEECGEFKKKGFYVREINKEWRQLCTDCMFKNMERKDDD